MFPRIYMFCSLYFFGCTQLILHLRCHNIVGLDIPQLAMIIRVNKNSVHINDKATTYCASEEDSFVL